MEAALWEAADAIKGSLSTDDMVLPLASLTALLALGRAAEEREAELAREGVGAEEARQRAFSHPVILPPTARRSVLSGHLDEPGEAILQAAKQLEIANANLKGLRHELQPLAHLPSTACRRVLGALSRAVNEGGAPRAQFEAIVRSLMEKQGGRGSAAFLPEELETLMVGLLRPEQSDHVHDFFCQAGGLVAALLRLEPPPGRVLGVEPSPARALLARLLGLFEQGVDVEVQVGDALLEPVVSKAGHLERWDGIISALPLGRKLTSSQLGQLAGDRFGRFGYGPGLHRRAAEMAYVQHALAALKPGGRAVLLSVEATLFRGGAEGQIRQALVEADLLEAVVTLPAGVLPDTGIRTSVLVLRRDKPAERRGQTLFINISGEREKRRTVISPASIQDAIDCFHGWHERERFARVVGMEEMAGAGFSLQISRFIDLSEPIERVPVDNLRVDLAELEANRSLAAGRMDALLEAVEEV
jgi:type I restriction enzyme M protein